ncbi:hypothetical protein PRZ48_003156 [Zasmidium cellare]|uniref:Zn(2)-C6 fungal-type domain-containing protein n=1 Tax=Zasmidium cellare TaxID=395010 RepID=A0ABR0EWH0_ZASCE|nr:hypothetical protein PRZ48_003156 [Zasmidium cellare]
MANKDTNKIEFENDTQNEIEECVRCLLQSIANCDWNGDPRQPCTNCRIGDFKCRSRQNVLDALDLRSIRNITGPRPHQGVSPRLRNTEDQNEPLDRLAEQLRQELSAVEDKADRRETEDRGLQRSFRNQNRGMPEHNLPNTKAWIPEGAAKRKSFQEKRAKPRKVDAHEFQKLSKEERIQSLNEDLNELRGMRRDGRGDANDFEYDEEHGDALYAQLDGDPPPSGGEYNEAHGDAMYAELNGHPPPSGRPGGKKRKGGR